eukprot:gene4087-2935_t
MFIRRLLSCCALCVGLSFAASPTSAQRSLQCQKLWTGPSADNSIIDCVKDTERAKSEWPYYVFPAVTLLLFISCMTWLSCLYCGCYCQCCCTCITHKPTREKSHYKLRKGCLTSMCLIPPALCICIFFVVGAVMLHKIVSDASDQVQNGPLAYFHDMKYSVSDLLTDYNKNPPQKPDIDLDEFDDVYNRVMDEVHDVDDFMKKSVIPGISVAAGVGVLVLLLTIISMFVTRCLCLMWCGGCCGWLYYLLGTIYALLAFVLSLCFYAVSLVCGEITRQYKREPGLFQWYVVPKLESEVNFTSIRDDVNKEAGQASVDACTELFKVCDSASTSPSSKPFVCGGTITSASECTTIESVIATAEGTHMNPTLQPTQCPAPEGMTDWKCTLSECVTHCSDDTFKKEAADTVGMINFAKNATTALSLVEPMLETNYIVDVVLTVLQSKENSPLALYYHGVTSRCTNIRLIMLMFAVSFFIGAFILLVSLCVLLSAYQARRSKPKKSKEMPSSVEEGEVPEEEQEVTDSQMEEAKELASAKSDDAVTGTPVKRDSVAAPLPVALAPSEPEPYSTSTYGIPAEFYQDDAVDEEEMLNRARQTSNRRLPLNPLARKRLEMSDIRIISFKQSYETTPSSALADHKVPIEAKYTTNSTAKCTHLQTVTPLNKGAHSKACLHTIVFSPSFFFSPLSLDKIICFPLPPKISLKSRFLLLLFAAVAAAAPAAAQNFGCASTWGEPSSDNDLLECVTNTKQLKSQWSKFLFIGVVGLTFVIITSKCQGILLSGCALSGTVCVVIFLLAGGITFQARSADALDGVLSGPVKYIETTRDNIEMYLTDYSTDPPTPPGIDLDEFDSLMDDVSDKVTTIKGDFKSIAVVLAASLLGALFLGLVLLAFIAVLCRCTNCACCCGWLYYLLAVIFCLLAIAMAVLAYFIAGLCGEVVLQMKREPGLFQWYLVPMLTETFDFENIRSDVNNELVKASNEACTQLLKVCDPSSQVAGAKPFVCGGGINTAADCTSINEVVTAVEGTYMRQQYEAALCPAPDGVSDWKCTLYECSTHCSQEEARSTALEVVEKAAFAVNASTALSLVEPILESNYVLDLILSVLEAKATSPMASYRHGRVERCADLRVGAIIVGVGFYVGSVMLLVALWVLLQARGDANPVTPDGAAEKSALPVSSNEDSRELAAERAKDGEEEDHVDSFDANRDAAGPNPLVPRPAEEKHVHHSPFGYLGRAMSASLLPRDHSKYSAEERWTRVGLTLFLRSFDVWVKCGSITCFLAAAIYVYLFFSSAYRVLFSIRSLVNFIFIFIVLFITSCPSLSENNESIDKAQQHIYYVVLRLSSCSLVSGGVSTCLPSFSLFLSVTVSFNTSPTTTMLSIYSVVRSSVCSFLLLLLAAVATAAPAAAQKPLGCAKVWGEPSSDNDIVKCITNSDRLKNQWSLLIFPAMIIIFFVVILLVLPFVCCLCCGNCCCGKNRKGQKLGKWNSIFLSGIAICGAVAVAIFLIAGGATFRKAFVDIIDGISSGPVGYLTETKDNIELYLTDYSTDPPSPPSIDLDEFDSMTHDINNEMDTIKDKVPSNVVTIVSVLLAVVFLGLIALTLVAAIFEWGKIACFCGWLYYVLAVLLALLAVVMAVLAYVVSGLCGEVVLQLGRKPGLFQWYVLPTLEDTFDFSTIREDVQTEVTKASNEACTQLLKVCDPSSQVAGAKPFVCGGGINTAADCTSINEVVTAVEGTYMRQQYEAALCPAPDGVSDWKCTLYECSTHCSQEEARSTALEVVEKAAFAVNASTALSLVEPILESNYVLDLILSVLEAKATSPMASYHHGSNDRCSNLRLSSILLEVAFFVGSIMLLFGLWVLLRTRRNAKTEEESTAEGPSTNSQESPVESNRMPDDEERDPKNEPIICSTLEEEAVHEPTGSDRGIFYFIVYLLCGYIFTIFASIQILILETSDILLFSVGSFFFAIYNSFKEETENAGVMLLYFFFLYIAFSGTCLWLHVVQMSGKRTNSTRKALVEYNSAENVPEDRKGRAYITAKFYFLELHFNKKKHNPMAFAFLDQNPVPARLVCCVSPLAHAFIEIWNMISSLIISCDLFEACKMAPKHKPTSDAEVKGWSSLQWLRRIISCAVVGCMAYFVFRTSSDSDKLADMVFRYHPVAMTLFVTGTLPEVLRTVVMLQAKKSGGPLRSTLVDKHQFATFLLQLAGAAGFGSVLYSKSLSGRPHLATPHAMMGMLCGCALVLEVTVGALLRYVIPFRSGIRRYLLGLHKLLSLTISISSMTAFAGGVFSPYAARIIPGIAVRIGVVGITPILVFLAVSLSTNVLTLENFIIFVPMIFSSFFFVFVPVSAVTYKLSSLQCSLLCGSSPCFLVLAPPSTLPDFTWQSPRALGDMFADAASELVLRRLSLTATSLHKNQQEALSRERRTPCTDREEVVAKAAAPLSTAAQSSCGEESRKHGTGLSSSQFSGEYIVVSLLDFRLHNASWAPEALLFRLANCYLKSLLVLVLILFININTLILIDYLLLGSAGPVWPFIGLVLVALSAAAVSAQRSLECQKAWTGPDKDNDILDCAKSTERIKSQWPYYVFPGIIIIFLMILLFILPFICCGCFCSCCRCCCTCCEKKPRKRTDVCKAIILGIVVVAGAVCVAIFFFTGGALLRKNTYGVIDEIESGPLGYFDDTKDNIFTYLTNYNKDPPEEPTIDLSEFDTVHDDVLDQIDSSRHTVDRSTTGLLIGTCVAGFLILLMSVIALLGAVFEWDRCACCFGWVYYLLAVLFCILAFVFSLTSYGLDAACGEIVLQFKREPGVFQWYVVPLMNDEFDFDSIRNDIHDEVTKASKEACETLLDYCDDGSSSGSKVFVCGNGLSDASQCTTLDTVVLAVEGTYMKPAYISAACPAPTSTNAPWRCTIADCVSSCTEKQMRDDAAVVVGQTNYAVNASTALSLVEPILETNYILDVVLSVLLATKTSSYASYDHKAVNRCADYGISSNVVAAAFFAGSILLLLGLLVLIWVRRVYDVGHSSRAARKNDLGVKPKKNPHYFEDDSYDSRWDDKEPARSDRGAAPADPFRPVFASLRFPIDVVVQRDRIPGAYTQLRKQTNSLVIYNKDMEGYHLAGEEKRSRKKQQGSSCYRCIRSMISFLGFLFMWAELSNPNLCGECNSSPLLTNASFTDTMLSPRPFSLSLSFSILFITSFIAKENYKRN